MSNRIFKIIFLTTISIVIAAMLIITGVLYFLYSKKQERDLKEELVYVRSGIEDNATAYLKNTKGNLRITIIDPQGNVVYDSSEDSTTMENHSKREEVLEALKNGEGEALRYSSTMGREMVYASTLLPNGNILRIAVEEPSFLQIFRELIQTYLIVIVLLLLITFFTAKYMSSSLIKPVLEIDLDNPESLEGYDELDPLIEKIKLQKQEITTQLSKAQKRQRDFETLTKNTQEGIITTDETGKILSINQNVMNLLQTAKLESPESVFDLTDNSEFIKRIEDGLKSGKKENFELTIASRVLEIIISPVSMESAGESNRYGLVVLIIDTTEKAKREKLRREYLSNISHELKTPLTSILGYAELIKSGIVAEEDIPKFSASIYEEAFQLKEMVLNLSSISKIDEAINRESLEEVDLERVVDKVISRLSRKAEKADVTLVKNTQSTNTTVLGSQQILTKLVYNLVDNSIKYNHRGGQVDIGIDKKDKKIILSVADTGCGIARDEQERVFERFYRTDKSRSKEIEGTGLGLAIVKHAALYHDAEIKLDSEVGAGTVIKVIFNQEI